MIAKKIPVVYIDKVKASRSGTLLLYHNQKV